MKGYNNLWLLAGVLPAIAYLGVAYSRQPTVKIENAYRYILAKRVATCEMESNAERMAANEFTKSEQFAALSNLLGERNQTLYDVENDLVERIMAGKGKF